MHISEKIKKIRFENNFTQESFSSFLGVPRYLVSNWEQGRSEPSIDDIVLIASKLNCSIDELLLEEIDCSIGREAKKIIEKDDSMLSDSERRLIKAFIQLDEDTQEKLIEDAEFYVQLAQSKSGAKRKA